MIFLCLQTSGSFRFADSSHFLLEVVPSPRVHCPLQTQVNYRQRQLAKTGDAEAAQAAGLEAVHDFGARMGLRVLFSLLSRSGDARWDVLQARLVVCTALYNATLFACPLPAGS